MKGGIVSQHDEDILAAEFAAVRLPLERRVAQLEAALRRLIAFALDHPEMDCAWYRVSMVETDVASAALAGAPEREGANG